jgi:hypothetical protein
MGTNGEEQIDLSKSFQCRREESFPAKKVA